MEKLLVSFSGGETSAYMAYWLWKHCQDKFEMVFVFANTGQENEETLRFVNQCSLHFGFHIVWVESVVHYGERKGSTHKIVDYNTADRDGKVFEDVIRKYGIPNMATPHCTRELKQAPIKSYAKSIGWKKYYTAIGIRIDEIDRINAKAKEMMFIYPLISKNMQPMTKPKINFWWSQMPFRLELKGYQGNCVTCWKKSNPKLYQIAKENPCAFDFMAQMEAKYPIDPLGHHKTFFRNNRSAKQILEESKSWNGKIKNDSEEYTYQLDLLGGESCEVFSECV